MNNLHPKVPRSCKDCGAKVQADPNGKVLYRCGSAEFVIKNEDTGEGEWKITSHSTVSADPKADNLSFKINLNINAAASENEVIQIAEEWVRNQNIRLEGWVHKRRCVSMHATDGVRWEIRFYGTFKEAYGDRMWLIQNLGLYLATYYNQKEFRFTDQRRTYTVQIVAAATA